MNLSVPLPRRGLAPQRFHLITAPPPLPNNSSYLNNKGLYQYETRNNILNIK